MLSNLCIRQQYRLVSTIPRNALRKWGLQGLSAPKSILDDHHTPVDLSEDVPVPERQPAVSKRPPKKPTPVQFKQHRETMKKNFEDGWNPPRKLSREAMDGLRQLHAVDKAKFSTPVLAEKFRISPEAVRRILKSKWVPPREKVVKQIEKDRRAYQEFVTHKRSREQEEAKQLLDLKRQALADKFSFQ